MQTRLREEAQIVASLYTVLQGLSSLIMEAQTAESLMSDFYDPKATATKMIDDLVKANERCHHVLAKILENFQLGICIKCEKRAPRCKCI